MLNIFNRTTGTKWLAYLGVAVLLVATVAQTAHFCGFQSLDLRDGTQLRPDAPNTSLCMTCLMAQSVAAIALSIVFFSVFRRRARVSPLHLQTRSFLVAFQLYVRPPPGL